MLPGALYELKRLAIDPGDKHVGYAHGEDAVERAGEWTPDECCENVVLMMTRNEVDEIVIEEFVLYAWESEKQSWSQLKTSQLIGALKFIAHMFRVPVVEQGAYVKKPTRKQLKGRGIDYVPGSIHSKDAQEHWYYRTIRAKAEEQK